MKPSFTSILINERLFIPIPFSIIKKLKFSVDQELFLSHSTGHLIFFKEQYNQEYIPAKIEKLGHKKEGYFIVIPTKTVAEAGYKLRQIYKISTTGGILTYSPFNKDREFIGVKERYIFDTSAGMLKEFRRQDREATYSIFNAGVGLKHWSRGRVY